MFKYIFALFLIFAVQQISTATRADFIGADNIGKCDVAKSVKVLPRATRIHGEIVDNGMTTHLSDGYHIYLNAKYLGRFSEFTQKFIMQHECGHAHGIYSETRADAYALLVLNPTGKQAKEVCQSLLEGQSSASNTLRCELIESYAKNHQGS